VLEAMDEMMDVPDLIEPRYMQVKKGESVFHPVHIEKDGSFSIATEVRDVGQASTIHDHGTWGVVGIYQGVEHEERFQPPMDGPLICTEEWDFEEGEIFICSVSGTDIHRVRCASDIPCVGIHIYGANIGSLKRHSYDPRTGKKKKFVSGWC
jgi:predicted metal-dependent enzyme (double-stranded beta helix superfamily)